MIRISSIALENYRAFFGLYEPILLPKGENLLLYGENGSGKSSLAKALNVFFQSSRDSSIKFEKNSFIDNSTSGKIEIQFEDFDPASFDSVPSSQQLFTFGDSSFNHNVKLVQDSELIKGFLSYRNLLDVYLSKSGNPNLFDLIILEVLKNHIPSGSNFAIGVEWKRIRTDLVADGRTSTYKNALNDLMSFQAILDGSLKKLIRRLNLLLLKYFKQTLRVDYRLLPMYRKSGNIAYPVKRDLRLIVKVNGITDPDHTQYLNEARLSALAICLFFAAMKENPIAFDYKILILDDAFIGLDTSNRYPVLNILKEEFKDYQIFITTYDRHWFELSQRFFNSLKLDRWKSIELYLTKENYSNKKFDKPLLILNENSFSKAVFHLHHPTKPDYPAAANYFRKYAEEILINNLPSNEIRNVDDDSLIESYKLGKLVNAGIEFLNKINSNTSLLVELQQSLPTLLHPLSHYDLSLPVYKGELIEIESNLVHLNKTLSELKNQYKILIPKGRMLKLIFNISATETGYYEIFTKETIYLLRDSVGFISISKGSCHCKCTYVLSNGNELSRHKFNNTDPLAQYLSIEDAYDKIFTFIAGQPQYSHINRSASYPNEFEFADQGVIKTLDQYLIW